MGKTLIEKILSGHGGGDCSPGDVVWVGIDNRTARDFAGASVVANLERYGGARPVQDVSKTFFTFDCNVPANTIPYAVNQQRIREFARANDVKVYDIDAGIGSHVLIEEGLARPGTTTIGTDSHLNIMGSVGAFGQGMGDVDTAFAFKTGRVWFEVPPSVRLDLTGVPSPSSEAKDVALAILGRFRNHELLGKSVEVYGEYLDEASLSDCITIASLATEMGAVSIMLPPNENVLAYFGMRREEAVYADPDAAYLESYTLDVEGLEPLVAEPPSPSNVTPVSRTSRPEIDTVFIGSCTNGTYSDLRRAAELIRGRRVSEGVTLKIVPATRKTWSRLLEEGYMQELFSAGAIISNAGCGGCASGQIGMTGEDEVQVSTSNRNFLGKQGRGMTYLTGIGTAVASAVMGRLSTVDDLEEVSDVR